MNITERVKNGFVLQEQTFDVLWRNRFLWLYWLIPAIISLCFFLLFNIHEQLHIWMDSFLSTVTSYVPYARYGSLKIVVMFPYMVLKAFIVLFGIILLYRATGYHQFIKLYN